MMNSRIDLIRYDPALGDGLVRALYGLMRSANVLNSYLDDLDLSIYTEDWFAKRMGERDRVLYAVLIGGDLWGFVVVCELKLHSARIHFGGIGKGTMAERLKIGKLAIDRLMDLLQIKRVWGLVSAHNKPALMFLNRIGAKRTGMIPLGSYHQKLDRFFDSVLLVYDGRD